VFTNTNLAAAAGLVAALLLAKVWFGKADLTMALNGALGGLVSITADPLSPTPLLAIFIGLIGGLLVVGSIVMLDRKFRIDDPVGAISVHGTAGIWGVLAVLLSNGDATVSGQLIGLLVIFSWVFLASLLVWFIIKKTVGIRVTEQQEYEGVDLHECGLEAYPEFTKAGD
jgi:Amt family ammonium transporter